MADHNSQRPFVLVVGPSGAGKDSLIAAARTHFAADPSVVFPRRIITRPPAQPGDHEIHHSVTAEAFQAAKAEGAFLLDWEAHQIHYGIPASSLIARQEGRLVIANVSRAVVEPARMLLGPLRVVVVTAPVPVLAERLARRGRETAQAIAGRLARADSVPLPAGPDVAVIDNSGVLSSATAAFLDLLERWRCEMD